MGSLGSGAPDVFVTISDWSNFTRQALKGYLLLEGKCERGPIGTAVLCSDFTDFRMTYGWLIDGSDFAYLVKRAMSYGARVVVNRIAHYEDPADPTTPRARSGSRRSMRGRGAGRSNGRLRMALSIRRQSSTSSSRSRTICSSSVSSTRITRWRRFWTR